MNPVLILTHNCLELTKKCVESIRNQDIPTDLFIFDNGSTDGTHDWLAANRPYINPDRFTCHSINCVNLGVSFGWNAMLGFFFEEKQDHVLVLNNDTALPAYFYRKLLSYDLPFVTGISVDEPNDHPDSWHQPAEHPDFSAFLIRRDCWERVGPFDERMRFYASDNDYHVRAHRAGIKLMNAGVPFHHERSSTLRHANPDEQRAIQQQADADRQVFKEKYGCLPWEPAYAELFK